MNNKSHGTLDGPKLVTSTGPVLKMSGRKLDFKADRSLIRKTVKDLQRVMEENKGLGLTACQIGVPVDIFIMNATRFPNAKKCNVLINTTYIGLGDKVESKESCLSLPGRVFKVMRYPDVEVTTHNTYGGVKKRVFRGLAAACVQQECDHVAGLLLFDVGTEVKSETNPT